MLLTTNESLPNHKIITVIGMVQGNTIRARHIGNDIMAGLRSIVGGEIIEYTKLLREAREQAKDRMITMAKRKGANRIINIRFETSLVMAGASELLVYGTAVILEEDNTNLKENFEK